MGSTQEPIALLGSVGTAVSTETGPLELEAAVAYAEATNDHNARYRSGDVLPPMSAVVAMWGALSDLYGQVVPSDLFSHVVHGEQDMRFHRPLLPGMRLRVTAVIHGVHVRSSGSTIVVRQEARDELGVVVDAYSTTFARGVVLEPSGGAVSPDHPVAPAAPRHPIATSTITVDADQTYRYAEASGDRMPIHLDDAFARRVGLPGVIVHGLCVMAMCGQAIVRNVADDDPSRLRRLAVRFADNVLPGSDVHVEIYERMEVDRGLQGVTFEATSGGAVVIRNGWAEVTE